MAEAMTARRPHYLRRLWAELGRMGGEHDVFIKVIIIDKTVRAVVLTALGIGLLVAGHNGWLDQLSDYAENQLNLNVGHGIIVELLLRGLVYIGEFNHITLLGVGALAYAGLETVEAVGLAMQRRWAEYLTVIATAILIPYEAYEVIRHPTLFKVGALVLNVAVVGYLTYRKRLFVGI
ncbi:MAG TPA: DUF2127 domain-containing protein [Candidatus Dormibacteraeota bacterium]|nr:DUF2127 domain-containing protein [Candidatus Dormibacteraeota bacterium]